jgi:hypothetical protein
VGYNGVRFIVRTVRFAAEAVKESSASLDKWRDGVVGWQFCLKIFFLKCKWLQVAASGCKFRRLIAKKWEVWVGWDHGFGAGQVDGFVGIKGGFMVGTMI